MKELKEWQLENCLGCKFADETKVGSGDPCCTRPGIAVGLDENGNCTSRKKQEVKDD